MKCKKCNNEIQNGFKFCPICGTPVALAIICPKCGATDIPQDSKFCPDCGAPLGVNKKESNRRLEEVRKFEDEKARQRKQAEREKQQEFARKKEFERNKKNEHIPECSFWVAYDKGLIVANGDLFFTKSEIIFKPGGLSNIFIPQSIFAHEERFDIADLIGYQNGGFRIKILFSKDRSLTIIANGRSDKNKIIEIIKRLTT